MSISSEDGRPDHSAAGAAVTRLILSVFRANGRMLRAGDAMTRDLGLTAARWQVLGAIQRTPKTVAQIAREFEQTRQGVLWVVQSMLKDSLIELADNPDHRRARLVRPTAAGFDAYRRIRARQAVWANGLGDAFDIADLSRAAEVIERLSEAIGSPQRPVD